ncbi:MAG: FAD-binding oxidoreductase [Bacteroidota bacterium]
MERKRFLIVGGGLAGSMLAARLCLREQEVVLLDDRDPHAASPIAAGLFNVITGRFGAKSWMADALVPALRNFLEIPAFQELKDFVHDSLIYRPFKTAEEYNKWTARSEEDAYKDWADFLSYPQYSGYIKNPLGGIMIKQCGWLDIPHFLQKLQQILSDQFKLDIKYRPFEEEKLDLDKLTYEDLGEFEEVVFCPGYRSRDISLFSELPIIPNKGEVLLLEIPELEIPFVLSKKVYLIPQGEQKFICGSTYKNQFDNPHPTQEGKEEICFHLEKALKIPYKVLEQRSGIRPTTPNRRPVLGTLPEHSHIHYFGGFGTKGVLLSPYFSEKMANHVCGGEEDFLKEVSIGRYLSS